MKHLLVACGLLLATTAHAQKAKPAAVGGAPIQFCNLLVDGRRFDKVEMKLDYGQNSKAQARDASLDEADIQVQQLNSVAAGLNYMYQSGWELVTVTEMQGNSAPIVGFNTLLGYLLRRRP